MAGHRKSPLGSRALTSKRPYLKLPYGDAFVRMRALVKGRVQVQLLSLFCVQLAAVPV